MTTLTHGDWLLVDAVGTPGLGHETVQTILDNPTPGVTFWMDANTPMFDPIADRDVLPMYRSGNDGLLLQVARTGRSRIRHVGRDDDPAWHPEAWADNGYVDVVEVRILTAKLPRDAASAGLVEALTALRAAPGAVPADDSH